MSSRYLSIATTPSLAAAQQHYGSAEQWARIGARRSSSRNCAEPASRSGKNGFHRPARRFSATRVTAEGLAACPTGHAAGRGMRAHVLSDLTNGMTRIRLPSAR